MRLGLRARDDHAGGPRKRVVLETPQQPWLQPGPRDARDLRVVVAVRDDERHAPEPVGDERGQHAGKLLHPQRLARAELPRMEQRHQQGIELRRPRAAAWDDAHALEQQRIVGEVLEALVEIGEVVDARPGARVGRQIVAEQTVVLSGAAQVGEPTAEGRQDAHRAAVHAVPPRYSACSRATKPILSRRTRVGHADRIARLDEEAGDAVLDGFRRAAHARRHDRLAGRRRLEQHAAERLGPRGGMDHHVGQLVERERVVVG